MSDSSQVDLVWTDSPPCDWSIHRIKSLFHDDTGNISVEQLAGLDVDHYSISAFDEIGTAVREQGATIASNKTLLRGGEILFSKLNSHKPRVWLIPQDEKIKVASTEFIALREWHEGSVCKAFVCYLLGSAVFTDYISCFQKSVTNLHKRISPENLWGSGIPLPPLPEQERIAAYLDASCAAIDVAVAAKRRQLETLDALQTTLIHECVSEGLDKNVEMKSSGIDWLPTMPKHWATVKLKRHTKIIRGQFSHRPRNDPAFYNGPYPFIQTGSISATDKFIAEFTQTLNKDGLRISKLFPKDTVVMSITGAKIAEVAVTTFQACFPDSIVGFVPDHSLHRDYLFYLLVAMKPALLRTMVVTTQPNINYVQIGGNYIPLPPVREQQAIARQIDQRIQEITDICEILNRQITTLIAYRKSLIHECVTGQRRITKRNTSKLMLN